MGEKWQEIQYAPSLNYIIGPKSSVSTEKQVILNHPTRPMDRFLLKALLR